ncbi:MAG: MBL fold metallo-hydrolase [Gemmatimonadaceae bacterium]|nr:MBL fold metallo-hydrolase [Gemmatimonadaceae bacterium]NUQ93210.1 MBL fold metallo-hydrolase [Gemmatimonadaceae bacterium]NUS96208.1 MBL fold metallo-hydrolase [Gemmatimonadaceae bacterium]
MFFQRFYDTGLAQASYIIGCQRTGDAVVVDPNRDVEQYIAGAAKEGLRVSHVTETHIHADFVSGARELASRAGAQLLLSDEGGSDWRYGYAADAGARLLHDGDHFMVGNIRVDVMHTPGHTPEHLSFVVTDTPAGAGPWGVLTGDFVFVGDVGRPDLLEMAAGMTGTMEAGARTLFRSLQRFRALPDHLQIWPGHGAGSACGKALGAIPSSTVGYEKIGNWGLAAMDENEFVRMVLAGQPEPPRYFAEMKRINRDGPRVLGGPVRVPRLPNRALEELLGRGEVVVDTRPAAACAAGHAPGTVNIPLGASFTTWAGWLLPYDRDIHLLVDEAHGQRVEEAVRDLAMIGLDRVAGVLGAPALDVWAAARRGLAEVAQVTAGEAFGLLARGEATVIDVRGAAEFDAGHLPDAVNIPLGYLAARIGEIPAERPVIVQCQAGARSAIAASVLEAGGRTRVSNLTGGYVAWSADGLPTERGSAADTRQAVGVPVGG